VVDTVDGLLKYRSSQNFRLQTNIRDLAAQQLLKLLLAAADEETPIDRLYTEHLAHALAFRLLVFAKASRFQPTASATAALPRYAMRRVEERMRDLESNLSLDALAKESGNSPVHFLRMFQAATGYTPHRYVIRLRVGTRATIA
jgi:AraC family transcriptional regulator